MSSRLLYLCRMTGNDNKAPLAKISFVRLGAGNRTSPWLFDLLCFHVHKAIAFAYKYRYTYIFLFMSRVNKIDVVP